MKKITLFFCFYSFLFASAQPVHDKKVIGYYAQWAIYARDYNVWDVDGSKLTHLLYSFFGTEFDVLHPELTKLKSLDPYADFDHNEGNHTWSDPYKGNFADLRDLKLKYPHLKIIISVGGWTKSQDFPAIAASPVARNALAADMANMITQYPWIDGFDIDWEFPLYGGTDGTEMIGGSLLPAQPHTAEDNKNLVYLLKAMKTAMPSKSISIAAGNSVARVAEQFIGPNNKATFGMTESIADFCDFITCFGYDFGGNWNNKTCYNAPLFGSGNVNDPLYDSDPKKVQSLENLVNIYLNDVGIPSDKLVMGLPMYGKLFNNVATAFPIPELPGLFVDAPRNTGACSNPQPPQGTWDATICEFSGSIEFCDYAGSSGTTPHHLLDPTNPSQLTSSSISAGWAKYWDNTAKVPYLYNAITHQFLMYEDEQSIDEKVKFILSKNLAGGMIWELSQDSRSTDPVPNRLLTQINTTFSTSPSNITVIFKDPTNNAISGVDVTLTKASDNSKLTATSDANGSVSFLDQQSNIAYTLTYAKAGYVFLPQTIDIPSLSDNPSFNIVGSSEVVNISGFVKTAASALIPNVVVKLLNSASEVLASQTSTDGNFNFSNVISGLVYKIKAEKQYYTFNEVSLGNVVANNSNVLLQGDAATYSITGTVKDGTTAIVGATVTASFNSISLTTTTNSLGEYSFSGLTPGIVYTMTVAKSGQSFLPLSGVFTLNANQIQNFVLNSYLFSGVVKNGSIPVSGAKVQLTLPWTDSLHGYKSILATTDASGKYFFDNSVVSGYTNYQSIVMNAWENNSTTFYPTYSGSTMPNVPQSFNFNTQSQAVDLNLTNPLNSGSVGIAPGSSIDLLSTASMLFQDGTTITSVVYSINGQDYPAVNSTGSTYSYSWTPSFNLFNKSVLITVLATASNGMTATVNSTFQLNCLGAGCPNQPPTIVWDLPSQTAINQKDGFTDVTIEVTATDTDGSVSEVSINIDNVNYAMSVGPANKYTYTFIPSEYKDYPVVIKVTDNEGSETLLNKTISINNTATSLYIISGEVKNGMVPVAGAKVQLTLPWTDDKHEYQSILATTDASGKYFFDNSVISGYTNYLSIVMNSWDNNSIVYHPNYSGSPIPLVPQIFNFNTQPQAVDLNFSNPLNSTSVSISLGSPIDLSSTASMLFQDGTTITSVVYTVNGQNYTASNTSGTTYSYSWLPPSNLFNTDIALSAVATASNGMTATATVTFHLNCSGVGCPNVAPTVVWNSPIQTTLNQANGFQPVNIEVTATDSDGSVSGVLININGIDHTMTAGSANKYTYSFTPTAYQDYPIIIKATDDLGLETVLNKTIKVINSIFIPLPEKVIVGYAHSWENSNAPFLYFNQMGSNKYNVVVYSFIETVASDGFTPVLTTNDNRYLTGGVFDPQLLKDDIAYLRNKGIPVLVSIGGQNGHVLLETTAQKNTFVAGIKSIIDQYQFDGLDLDFEGGSMSFGAAALTDFSYSGISAYPKLKNLVDAVKELKTFYGSGFHITAAPETFYVQVGLSSYTNTTGAFLPVINNIRDELDLLMVQLYNTGSVNALDGMAYSQATPDFLVSMSDMLIKGFDVASTGYHFNGLPASKIVVGIPSCSSAAPAGGYIAPSEAIKALDYLRFGTTYSGRNYTLQSGGPYPNLRGVMTWSINWDAAANCASEYEFANAYSAYFGSDLGNNYPKFNSDKITIYESKGTIHINTGDIVMENVLIFDLKGALLEERTKLNTTEVKIMTKETDCVLIVKVVTKEGTEVTKKIIVHQ